MTRLGSFDEVLQALCAGRAAVFPTDTVYGIGVAVTRAESPLEIYTTKRRDHNKAIPWLVDSDTALTTFGSCVPEYAFSLAQAFWPGPLTMVIPASGAVPRAFGSEDCTVALRMPDDQTALNLIARVGCPLATSSANFQGCTPPQTYADIEPEFLAHIAASCGDDVPRSGRSSTIVDCTRREPRLLRLGDISAEDVQRAVGL